MSALALPSGLTVRLDDPLLLTIELLGLAGGLVLVYIGYIFWKTVVLPAREEKRQIEEARANDDNPGGA